MDPVCQILEDSLWRCFTQYKNLQKWLVQAFGLNPHHNDIWPIEMVDLMSILLISHKLMKLSF